MAGDVNVGEALLTSLPEGASSPPIIHEYGPNIRISLASGSDSDDETGRISAAPLNLEVLNATERFGYEAFVLRNTSEYATAKSSRPYDGEKWDRDAGSAPADDDGSIGSVVATSPALQSRTSAPGTSDRLTGRVAVGTIIVSGPSPRLRISQSEQSDIFADIQNGLSWLAAQSPLKDVTWVHDIRSATVTVPDTTSGSACEAFESPWRDEAFRSLGLAPGLVGVLQYVNDLRASRATNGHFVL
jgi:hypothetical protein